MHQRERAKFEPNPCNFDRRKKNLLPFRPRCRHLKEKYKFNKNLKYYCFDSMILFLHYCLLTTIKCCKVEAVNGIPQVGHEGHTTCCWIKFCIVSEWKFDCLQNATLCVRYFFSAVFLTNSSSQSYGNKNHLADRSYLIIILYCWCVFFNILYVDLLWLSGGRATDFSW